ncbi:LysM peptidoglycan-binding domain-containing protein [Acidiphilium acidophilum]|uniref:LysM domain-containing protein n=1 Tax=Acidiphilium acidophilum TaxID=76588 RepID=A0AAW9DS57_ACIAO|nr:LysM domain-containing protein [Acidiphilium acidophilum]MDX5930897.1 LysM domain-containing protein [Acidiphilium acidophilum]
MEKYEIYTVRQGDCLWDIAGAYYGHPVLWPSLYSLNNWAAAHHVDRIRPIVNPNLIYPGERLLLKPLPVHRLKPLLDDPRLIAMVPRTEPAPPRGSLAGMSIVNPAKKLGFKPFFALSYDFGDVDVGTYEAAGFTAEISYGGSITLQPDKDAALVTLSNTGVELDYERAARTVVGQLVGGAKVRYDPAAAKAGGGRRNPLGFSCALTRVGHGGVPDFTVEIDGDAVTCTLTFYPVHGNYHGYVFYSSDFRVTAKVTKNEASSKNGGSRGSGQNLKIVQNLMHAPRHHLPIITGKTNSLSINQNYIQSPDQLFAKAKTLPISSIGMFSFIFFTGLPNLSSSVMKTIIHDDREFGQYIERSLRQKPRHQTTSFPIAPPIWEFLPG